MVLVGDLDHCALLLASTLLCSQADLMDCSSKGWPLYLYAWWALQGWWVINEWLIAVRFLTGCGHLTKANNEAADNFYQQQHATLNETPRKHVLMTPGNFNGKIGKFNNTRQIRSGNLVWGRRTEWAATAGICSCQWHGGCWLTLLPPKDSQADLVQLDGFTRTIIDRVLINKLWWPMVMDVRVCRSTKLRTDLNNSQLMCWK